MLTHLLLTWQPHPLASSVSPSETQGSKIRQECKVCLKAHLNINTGGHWQVPCVHPQGFLSPPLSVAFPDLSTDNMSLTYWEEAFHLLQAALCFQRGFFCQRSGPKHPDYKYHRERKRTDHPYWQMAEKDASSPRLHLLATSSLKPLFVIM